MNLQNPLLADMADATRLLRQGDLRAATAAIQEHLRRGAPRDESQTVRDAIDGEFVIEAADPASVVTEVGDECEAGQAPSPRPHDPAPEPTGLDRFSSHAFHGRPGARDYKLYVPARYRGQAMPLIVMLHGCTQSPDDFSAGTQVNALAEEQGFLVAYPAQSRSANASLCWNWFNASEQRRDGSEASIIRGIVAEIQGAYAIDPCRIFVAGLSAGGAMAAIMAAAHSDLFAAACVHSGLPVGAAHDMPSALAAMRGGSGNTALPFIAGAAAAGVARRTTPLIVFHGDRDATVSPRNADQLVAQWRAMAVERDPAVATELATSENSGRSASGRSYTRKILARDDGTTVVEHWRLHGAGHAWSGGSRKGSYTDANGPDASREMLRFFLDNALT